MQGSFEQWRHGNNVPPLADSNRGDWCWINRLALSEDLLVYAPADQELMANRFERLRFGLRLDDSDQLRAQVTTYRRRWRQFLALFNFFQFSGVLLVFTTSEVEAGTAPNLELAVTGMLSGAWKKAIEETVSSLEPFVKALAAAARMVPEVEYYSDDVGDELFAELAWPDLKKPVAVLAGDQASFAEKWQTMGWIVCTDSDLKAKGWQWMIELLPEAAEGVA
jgi:DEAD/DEAH box helicase domain-containing protein